MKIKSNINTVVHTDKDNRVVVVTTTTDCSLLAIDMICRFESSKGYHTCSIDKLSNYALPDKFKGVARCIDSDEFSEAKGIEIATKKLYTKLYSSINKQLVLYKKSKQKEVSDMDTELVAKDDKLFSRLSKV